MIEQIVQVEDRFKFHTISQKLQEIKNFSGLFNETLLCSSLIRLDSNIILYMLFAISSSFAEVLSSNFLISQICRWEIRS